MDQWVDDPIDLQTHDLHHADLQDPFGHYDQPIQRGMEEFLEEMYDTSIGKHSHRWS